MKLEKQRIILGGNEIEVEIAHMDKKDGKEFKRLFDVWRKLNIGLEKYGRKVNIPEVISEGMFCIFSKSVRYQKKVKGKGTVSFDTINIKNKRREQIKASSIEFDLTTFVRETEGKRCQKGNGVRNRFPNFGEYQGLALKFVKPYDKSEIRICR